MIKCHYCKNEEKELLCLSCLEEIITKKLEEVIKLKNKLEVLEIEHKEALEKLGEITYSCEYYKKQLEGKFNEQDKPA